MDEDKSITRRDCLKQATSVAAGLALSALAEGPTLAQKPPRKGRPIPVILDTDIGDDIDDTWALTMLLKSPEFDLRLVTTTNGKAEYRAKIIARLLTAAGRTDVAIGLGTGSATGVGGQADWVRDYQLSEYKGKVYKDGVKAFIDTASALAAKGTPATVIAIGPLTTLDDVLTKDNAIAQKLNFVGMDGSVRKGYSNSPTPCVECNMGYVPGSKKVFTAPWKSMAITPLDTCGLIQLRGDLFTTLKQSKDAAVHTMLDNYRIWAQKATLDEMTESSILYDTVAVYLANPANHPLLGIEHLPIKVGDDGMTLIDQAGKQMDVATTWTDLDAYAQHLVNVLQQPVVKPRRR